MERGALLSDRAHSSHHLLHLSNCNTRKVATYISLLQKYSYDARGSRIAIAPSTAPNKTVRDVGLFA